MRAYLIDPFTETVNEVVHHDARDVRAFIHTDTVEATHVGMFSLNDGRLVNMVIYVDQSGFYTLEQKWFRFGAYPNPISGRGLLVGLDANGQDIDPPMDLPACWSVVTWLGEGVPDLPDRLHYPPGDGKRVKRYSQNDERQLRMRRGYRDGDGSDGDGSDGGGHA